MSTEPIRDADVAPAGLSAGDSERLAKRLRPRHLTMMGLGSAIGAGLFLGSGKGISIGGPAVLISYAVAGVLVIFVMRMLAEMAAEVPSSGSFSVYAEKALGRWAGFLLGWVYWFMLVMVLGVEISGAAAIMHGWAPSVPQWVFALIGVVFFAVINLAGVRSFGEMEFWFASIKVAAIIVFLVVGVLLVFGLLPDTDAAGTANLLDHGGFFPTGATGMAAALLVVAFAFGGIEIVAIAAAEAHDPRGAVARATRSIVWRILFFYIGSIAIMVTVFPWDSPQLTAEQGPFAAVFELAHLPWLAKAMETVVVLALLSAFNAQIYGTSRMAYSLSLRGDGPARMQAVSRRGVPWVSVAVSVAFSFVAVLLNYWLPEEIMGILLNAVGASLLVVWLMIAFSHLALRPKLERQAAVADRPMLLRVRGYPYVTWAVIIGYLAITALMVRDPDARPQIYATAALVVIILAIYAITVVARTNDEPLPARTAIDDPGRGLGILGVVGAVVGPVGVWLGLTARRRSRAAGYPGTTATVAVVVGAVLLIAEVVVLVFVLS